MIKEKQTMAKLCINSRDELRLVDLQEVAYLKASGCYTDFHFVSGKVRTEAQCLSAFEEAINSLYTGTTNPFIRIGRSHLVNTGLVSSISITKEQLTFLSDGLHPLFLSRRLLRKLKEQMIDSYGVGLRKNPASSERNIDDSERKP